MERLRELAASFSVTLTDEMLVQFERYYEMLIDWNERINLTAITEKNEIMVKHFADSILPASKIRPNSSLCDVGTGAGFPGIPLKIAIPELKLTLMDSLNKRVLFLEEVCKAMGWKDVVCRHMRAEDAGQGEYREKFDVVTSRAVARLNTLCEYTLPLVRVGGKLIAYKANCSEEIAEAKNAIRLLGGTLESAEETELDGQHRTLVVVSKTSATPKRFPRGKGKEKNDPIL